MVILQLVSVGDRYGFDGTGRFAHSGMLKAAISIREDLDENDTLAKIYGVPSSSSSASSYSSQAASANSINTNIINANVNINSSSNHPTAPLREEVEK